MTPTTAPTRPDQDTTTRSAEPQVRKTEQPTRDPKPAPSGPGLGWIVIAVAFVAAIGLVIAAVTGGGPDQGGIDPADVVGSDVHLENLADDVASRHLDVIGSDQHLLNQAAELAPPDVSGSDQHLLNQAEELAPPTRPGSDQHLHNLATAASDS